MTVQEAFNNFIHSKLLDGCSEITITDKMEGKGKVTYFYEGQDVGSAEVSLTPEYVKEQTGYDITPQITKNGSAQDDTPEEKAGLSLPVKILTGVGAVLAVSAVVFCAAVRYRLAKKRKRRRALARRRRKERSVRRSAESSRRYARARDPHPSARKRRR